LRIEKIEGLQNNFLEAQKEREREDTTNYSNLELKLFKLNLK
jgi:hypothetical protein